MTMHEIQNYLIRKARNTYKKIFPCKGKTRLEECFTIEGTKMIFWFNTEDRNTHTISAPLSEFLALNEVYSLDKS